MRCKLCDAPFKLKRGQKDAYWAINWCTGDSGKLCPSCHKAAVELKAVSSTPLSLGVCPFGSDIMEKSKAVSKKKWKNRRASESLQKWIREQD